MARDTLICGPQEPKSCREISCMSKLSSRSSSSLCSQVLFQSLSSTQPQRDRLVWSSDVTVQDTSRRWHGQYARRGHDEETENPKIEYVRVVTDVTGAIYSGFLTPKSSSNTFHAAISENNFRPLLGPFFGTSCDQVIQEKYGAAHTQ